MFGLDSSLLVPHQNAKEENKKESHYEPTPAANGSAKKEKWSALVLPHATPPHPPRADTRLSLTHFAGAIRPSGPTTKASMAG